MLKGLPASSKTTYAMELVKQGYKRVNKDDIRAMVDFSKWSRVNEETIKSIEIDLVQKFLKMGFNVVEDNTNFAYEDFWRQFAQDMEVDFEIKFFDVPLGECIDRDAKRGEKSVGAQVICSMYEKYLYKPVAYDPKLPDCYIFDIDGTLAKMSGRSPYDYTKVDTDIENNHVTRIFRILKNTNSKIFICSGRDSCREETEKWLKEKELNHDGLFMRYGGDKRKDSIIKTELYKENIEGKYNVLGVFDDRLQVCRAWYELGLPLFRVGNPDSNF